MFNAETITNVANAAYVVAALLFILALAGLSKHETSKSGLTYGIVGMGIALVAMVIALLSTLYPSWRAAATQPAEALRYE